MVSISNSKRINLIVVIGALIAAAPALAFAQNSAVAASAKVQGSGSWTKDHPRRVQVNKRLNNQNKRINQEVKSGEITKAQAQVLHKEGRLVRQEERAMASQNGTHITKQEQKTLNQQENAISAQIGK